MTPGAERSRPDGRREARFPVGPLSPDPDELRAAPAAEADLRAELPEVLGHLVGRAVKLWDGHEGLLHIDSATEIAEGLAVALSRLVAEAAEVHEWRCPNCGATTRARMADRPAAPAAEADLRAEMIAALPGIHPWGDVVDALLAGPLQRLVEQAAEHGPRKCVPVDDANRVLGEERDRHAATAARLVAEAAEARRLREAVARVEALRQRWMRLGDAPSAIELSRALDGTDG